MSIPRYLLSSTVLSGAVFTAATLPMAALDSKPVTIQVEDDPIFVGQLKELAGPYMGLATAMSLGMGVMSLTMLGWSQSSGKLAQSQDEIAKLQKELHEREALVERMKYSEARIEASGLSLFMEDEDAELLIGAEMQNHLTASTPDSAAASSPMQKPQPYQVTTSIPAESHPADIQKLSAKPPLPPRRQPMQHSAATAMPSAQALSGFVRTQAVQRKEAVASGNPVEGAPESATQLNELLYSLKQVMAQVEMLHQVQPAAAVSPGQNSFSSPAA